MQLLRLMLITSIGSLLSACVGGPSNIESDLGIKGAPDWVNEGSQAVSDKGGRLIHGMGSSNPLGNEALQRSTADNRARAEIARVVSSYMDVTLHDFMQAQTAVANNTENTGMHNTSEIEQTIHSASNVVINGSKIIGRWKDKRTGILYSFAELDLKKLNQAISTAEKLNQNYKQYYESNNGAIFDQFAKGVNE